MIQINLKKSNIIALLAVLIVKHIKIDYER